MITAKCISKFRDKQGRIYGYRLQDNNGVIKDIKAENLKSAIYNKQISVTNIKLTSDNRLISCNINTSAPEVVKNIEDLENNNKVRKCVLAIAKNICKNLGYCNPDILDDNSGNLDDPNGVDIYFETNIMYKGIPNVLAVAVIDNKLWLALNDFNDGNNETTYEISAPFNKNESIKLIEKFVGQIKSNN